jgi:hypothetical protein
VDPRQASLLGAGWTLGSLKYLGESGVESLTYYETHGPRGLLAAESARPSTAGSPRIGGVFPVYHLFADLAELAGGALVPTTSSHRLAVLGLTLQLGPRRRHLIANLSPQARRVQLRGLPNAARVRHLDASTTERASQAPDAFRAEPGALHATSAGALELTLPPCGIARVDTGP